MRPARAITTSHDGNAQRYCERSPSSSSTISNFGLTPCAVPQAVSVASSATAKRTEGSSRRIVVPPGAAQHQQVATGLAQQFASLVRADAVAAAFGRGERAEQFVANELGCHSLAVVDDVDHHAQRLVPDQDAHRAHVWPEASIALLSRCWTTASNDSGSIATPACLRRQKRNRRLP